MLIKIVFDLVLERSLLVLHNFAFHREHDKNPEEFFDVMLQLHDEDIPFKLSVLGQTYQDVPGE